MLLLPSSLSKPHVNINPSKGETGGCYHDRTPSLEMVDELLELADLRAALHLALLQVRRRRLQLVPQGCQLTVLALDLGQHLLHDGVQLQVRLLQRPVVGAIQWKKA